MAKVDSTAQLASNLARAAREIARTYPDSTAQFVAFGLAICRWDLSIERIRVLAGFGEPEMIRRIDELLDQADLPALLARYASEGKDPSVDFYEEFFRAFDPARARGRGVRLQPA